MPRRNLHGKRDLLLIEDDGYCKFFLHEVCRTDFVKITTVRSLVLAYEIVQENDFDAILIDVQALTQNELSPVQFLHEINEQIPIVVVSERDDVDFAVEVLRAGAFDYLTKPFNNIARVEKAINGAVLKRENARQAVKLSHEELSSHGLIGESKRIKDLLVIINQIAPLNVNVIVTGESGTGKELVARAIHARGNRSRGPFFAVNCGALPEGLVESIFFGHEKGAFTGASQAHAGFLEKAHGGTLFLDEVGESSPKAQVALLRFLQDREFVRVGGDRTLTSDARIIASTNRNLEDEVAGKQFRADLYFRLNVVHLKVPPLRDRPEDIVYLADYFVRRFCLLNNIPIRKVSPQAVRLLEGYDWPGNVRELENMVEGLLATLPVKKQNITEPDILDFSEKIRSAQDKNREPQLDTLVSESYREALAAFEASYLKAILDKHEGNVTRAARTAGIHPVTFHRKLRKLKVEH
jgi:DNA-binding NtrC family response regulator